MEDKNISIWYDNEGDYLEINFKKCGETYFDEVKKNCFEIIEGNTDKIIGYSIIGLKDLEKEFTSKNKKFAINYNKNSDSIIIKIKDVRNEINNYIISNISKRKFTEEELNITEEMLA